MMFVALAMFVRIFGKQGFVVAAFNQADQFCRTFRAFYPVAGFAIGQIGRQHGGGFRLPCYPISVGGTVKLRIRSNGGF